MLYNNNKKSINTNKNCLDCPFFKKKKCTGLGKVCFEFDKKTGLLIDPFTKKLFKKEN